MDERRAQFELPTTMKSIEQVIFEGSNISLAQFQYLHIQSALIIPVLKGDCTESKTSVWSIVGMGSMVLLD